MADTRKAYRSDAWVSRKTWRIVVTAWVATIAAVGFALLAIESQSDVRRATPAWSDELEREQDTAPHVSSEWSIDPGSGSIADGRLQLYPFQPNSPALAVHMLPAVNFVAEAQARAVGGSTDNAYGIVVGGEGALTAFLISGDGYFGVMRKAAGSWIDVQAWRQWPHVRRDNASNTFRLECDDGSCAFYVNEEITTRVGVESTRETIGLMTWRYTSERLIVEFEYLRIWEE